MKKAAFFVVFSVIAVSLFAQSGDIFIGYYNCFLGYLKRSNTDLTDTLIEEYISDYDWRFYQRNRNNEFEWPDILEQHRDRLRQAVLEHDADSEYGIAYSVEFGTYDFAKRGFPIDIRRGTTMSINSRGADSKLKPMAIFLEDFEKYSFFPIGRDEANELIKSRTDNETGEINRRLTILIYFKMGNFSGQAYSGLVTRLGSGYFPVTGTIINIEAYNGDAKIGDLMAE